MRHSSWLCQSDWTCQSDSSPARAVDSLKRSSTEPVDDRGPQVGRVSATLEQLAQIWANCSTDREGHRPVRTLCGRKEWQRQRRAHGASADTQAHAPRQAPLSGLLSLELSRPRPLPLRRQCGGEAFKRAARHAHLAVVRRLHAGFRLGDPGIELLARRGRLSPLKGFLAPCY